MGVGGSWGSERLEMQVAAAVAAARCCSRRLRGRAGPGGTRRALALGQSVGWTPISGAVMDMLLERRERELKAAKQHDSEVKRDVLDRDSSFSRLELTYPFETDASFRNHYRNPFGTLRVGKVMEDLDIVAGHVALRHCDDENAATPPLDLVTASIDKIKALSPTALGIDRDLHLTGQVVWTGRTSINLHIELRAGDEPCLSSNFIFVARDPYTYKAVPINRLVPNTVAEKANWEKAQKRADILKSQGKSFMHLSQNGLLQEVGTDGLEWCREQLSESETLSQLPTLAHKRNEVTMAQTQMQMTSLQMPQEQNIYGKVFGGTLCRRAYELAFCSVYSFGGSQPTFIEVDRIDFLAPVEVGSIVRLDSQVLHTGQHECGKWVVFCEVRASVLQPEKGESSTTNTFTFTFATENPLANVFPANLEEAWKAWKCRLALTDLESPLLQR